MSNAQKKPFAQSLNAFASKRILEHQENQGLALPCSVISVSGQIVTVNFEVSTSLTVPTITCPIIGAEYIRMPTQVGDKGFCIAADARLGGISGLGSGLAPLVNPGNLGALVFVPIGNKDWSTVDPNAVTIYGPNGVVLRDSQSKTVMTLTPSGLTLVYGGSTITVDSNGVAIDSSGTLSFKVGSNYITISPSGVDIEGAVTINGRVFLLHEHSGVQPGTGVSGGVV